MPVQYERLPITGVEEVETVPTPEPPPPHVVVARSPAVFETSTHGVPEEPSWGMVSDQEGFAGLSVPPENIQSCGWTCARATPVRRKRKSVMDAMRRRISVVVVERHSISAVYRIDVHERYVCDVKGIGSTWLECDSLGRSDGLVRDYGGVADDYGIGVVEIRLHIEALAFLVGTYERDRRPRSSDRLIARPDIVVRRLYALEVLGTRRACNVEINHGWAID